MANLFQRLSKLFSRAEPEPALSMEELRAIFRARYHAFKLLLAANNTALQLMTDMEAALHGNQSFGMTFIRSHCTAVCVNVFNIIRNLNELTENRYQALNIFAISRNRLTPPYRNDRRLDLGVGAPSKTRREMADGVVVQNGQPGRSPASCPSWRCPGVCHHRGRL
jgi:hypothetical protein